MDAETGRGKRAPAEASGDQPPDSKRQKMADWCVDCKAAARDACRGGHRVLDMGAAERDAQAKLTAARAAVAAAKAEIAVQQAHLHALTQARVLQGPVLTAEVASRDGDEDGWTVPGGPIRIALASTVSLTDDTMQAVCAALENLEVEYEVDGTESTIAWADLGAPLNAIIDKLPDCVEGQAARRGDVLLCEDRIEVFFRDMPSRGGPFFKVFGHVMKGLDALEGIGCDERIEHDPIEEVDEEDMCESGRVGCFCGEDGEPGSTILRDVKFEA